MMLFSLFSLILFGYSPYPVAHSLQLNISNVTPGKGNVMIAVHNKDNFLKSRLYEKSIPATAGTIKLNIDLSDGTYAVAVYQDLNQNALLDTNIFGIPIEPYGFSNNVRPKLRAPTFDEAGFGIYSNLSVNIRLEKW